MNFLYGVLIVYSMSLGIPLYQSYAFQDNISCHEILQKIRQHVGQDNQLRFESMWCVEHTIEVR